MCCKALKAILLSFQTNEDLRRVFEPHGRPLSFELLKIQQQRGRFINAIKIKHHLIKQGKIQGVFSLGLPRKVLSTEKLILARLVVSRTIFVNVDLSNLGSPNFIFLVRPSVKNTLYVSLFWREPLMLNFVTQTLSKCFYTCMVTLQD